MLLKVQLQWCKPSFTHSAVNMHDFVVGGRLNMPVYRFALRASQIDSTLDTLVTEAGLTPKYNLFSQCNFE